MFIPSRRCTFLRIDSCDRRQKWNFAHAEQMFSEQCISLDRQFSIICLRHDDAHWISQKWPWVAENWLGLAAFAGGECSLFSLFSPVDGLGFDGLKSWAIAASIFQSTRSATFYNTYFMYERYQNKTVINVCCCFTYSPFCFNCHCRHTSFTKLFQAHRCSQHNGMAWSSRTNALEVIA